MTFCVSHQKLLDNVSSNFVTENIKKEDTMRNHENDTVQSTASIELGEWIFINDIMKKFFGATFTEGVRFDPSAIIIIFSVA